MLSCYCVSSNLTTTLIIYRVVSSEFSVNVMKAKVVVSSCKHDGPFGAIGVKRLKSIGMIDSIHGMKALDINTTKDGIMRLTREIGPGKIVTGMEVAEFDGVPKMVC